MAREAALLTKTKAFFSGHNSTRSPAHKYADNDLDHLGAGTSSGTFSPRNRVPGSGLKVYKIVVLGDGAVGKSALTQQFVNHSFLDYHDPTIEDSYQKQCVIDGEPALLDILDTAGQAEFTAMRDQYMRCGEGFLICYSVTDRHSFQEVLEYHKLIQKVRANENTPVVLVGNKYDLQAQRKVSPEEGKNLAKQFGYQFFETSAALRAFVDDAFHTLVREIRRNDQLKLGLDTANDGRPRRHSKWWRIRSIFALVFRKKRHVTNMNNI